MVDIGDVYTNTNGNLVLLVLARSKLVARCVVLWTNEAVMTAFRTGEVDSWRIALIEEHWKRVN